ncbi:MAG: hypothetical protein ACLVJ4_01985 [Mediterraneibacter sp.]
MSNKDRMNKIEELKSLQEQLLEYKRAMGEDDDGNSEASHVKQLANLRSDYIKEFDFNNTDIIESRNELMSQYLNSDQYGDVEESEQVKVLRRKL